MTIINNVTHAAVAALLMPARTKDLIAFAQNVVGGMSNNPAFPTPGATRSPRSRRLIQALVTAENNVALRTKGTVTTRNLARTTLVTQLKQLRAYVQTIADGDLENGAAIIERCPLLGPQDARPGTPRLRRRAGAHDGHGEARRARGRPPRRVRLAVQRRRREDLAPDVADAAGEAGGHRSACGHRGPVPLPRGHQDRSGGLERPGHAHGEVGGLTAPPAQPQAPAGRALFAAQTFPRPITTPQTTAPMMTRK